MVQVRLVAAVLTLVFTSVACSSHKPAVSDAIDACAVFGRLRVERSERAIGQEEIKRRLNRAIRRAQDAARKDSEWTDFLQKLETLRDLASDPTGYQQVEDQVWAICGPYVGT